MTADYIDIDVNVNKAGPPMPLTHPPDFVVPPASDLTRCAWWRPCRVCIPPADGSAALARFTRELAGAFADQGHHVTMAPDERTDIVIACAAVPAGGAPLADRIAERPRPLLVEVAAAAGLRRRPQDLVTLVAVEEDLGAWPHEVVVDTARQAMARIGTPKVAFLTTGPAGFRAATLCTMEGGHPTDREDLATRLRDRLVAAACAREVSGRYEVVQDALPGAAWAASAVPDAIVAAGRRMDRLGLLPPPRRLADYVSPPLARLYERLLGIKGFSEGMLFAHDPGLDALLVTASGSWDVDKRALQRDEVVAVRGAADGRLQVLAPEGAAPKGPSVEAWEMAALVAESPSIRAGIHVHVGITGTDERRIETVPANRELFPFGFGCGTDLMCAVAQDAARRSSAMNDPDDPRAYVRWPMLYHGDTIVELRKPGVADTPLEGLLDLFSDGGIAYDPDHIDQPV
jgi:hypothetical protein